MADKYVMVVIKAENISHAKIILGSENFNNSWVRLVDLNTVVELSELTRVQTDIARYTPVGKEYQKQLDIKNSVDDLVDDYDLDSDVKHEILEIIKRALK